jgi:glycosyltransferase involved in cell wall biosynthesis
MNLWEKHVDELMIVAPLRYDLPNSIDLPYKSVTINFISVPSFDLIGLRSRIFTILKLPILLWRIFKAMRSADHIHLRCPGNIGLLATIVQVLFPQKMKTAKYAGNWDWNSKQPFSYRLQQKILRNTLVTKNMKVLVYGDWKETSNIKPFFTASYSKREILETPIRKFENRKAIKLIFVGSLVDAKRPMLGLEVSRKLSLLGIKNEIHFYGEGVERPNLEAFIKKNSMQISSFLHGNVDADEVKQAFQESHFLLFISKSEGWPKAVAESMFWGCLPLTSAVSCVPEMIGHGERGDLIEPIVNLIVEKINFYLQNPAQYNIKCSCAMNWSREFTLEKFENEIKLFLNSNCNNTN